MARDTLIRDELQALYLRVKTAAEDYVVPDNGIGQILLRNDEADTPFTSLIDRFGDLTVGDLIHFGVPVVALKTRITNLVSIIETGSPDDSKDAMRTLGRLLLRLYRYLSNRGAFSFSVTEGV